MKYLSVLFLLAIGISACKQTTQVTTDQKKESNGETTISLQSIHSFKVEDIAGETFDFSSLKGKKILVVNTASKCGLTPQYKDLQTLYEKYEGKLEIVGFPANNFMFQEPGNNEKIKTFCESKYGVTFPMMAKISVKGKDQHPIYKFLTKKMENGVSDSKVTWNFQKYLLDENGYLVKSVSPKVKPMDEQIVSWLEG